MSDTILETKDDKASHRYTGKYVVVRTYYSGVHCGILHTFDSQTKEIFLTNTRRIFFWKGANKLPKVATSGVGEGSKLSITYPEINLMNVIEIIPTTDEGAKCLQEFPPHIPK